MNIERLREEFDQVYTRPGTGGKVFTYVRPVQVMDRLDEVFGPAGWSADYDLLYADDRAVVMRCRLTVNGATVAGVGEANRQTSPEAFKAAASDSLKRAAVHLGVARYLYEEPQADTPAAPPAPAQAARPAGATWVDEKGELRIQCPDHGAWWGLRTRNGTVKCKRRVGENEFCQFETAEQEAEQKYAPQVEAEYRKLLDLQKQHGWTRQHLAAGFGINEVNAALIKNAIASGMSAAEIDEMAMAEMEPA